MKRKGRAKARKPPATHVLMGNLLFVLPEDVHGYMEAGWRVMKMGFRYPPHSEPCALCRPQQPKGRKR